MHRPTNPAPFSLRRRELLRLGGLSVVGGSLPWLGDTRTIASQDVTPRATARQVLDTRGL
jgi:hypothetical protein